ncbi:MAG: hypothetical protein AAGJ35_14835, partial [Myxococcota bacterium]
RRVLQVATEESASNVFSSLGRCLSMLRARSNVLQPQEFILRGICNALELGPSMLRAIAVFRSIKLWLCVVSATFSRNIPAACYLQCAGASRCRFARSLSTLELQIIQDACYLQCVGAGKTWAGPSQKVH